MTIHSPSKMNRLKAVEATGNQTTTSVDEEIAVQVSPTEQADLPQRAHRTYWWKEALIMGVFYQIYSWSRKLFG